MQETVIVVPCYNEAARLHPNSFIEYCLEHPGLSFVFVDDGSTDATFAVLSQSIDRLPAQLSVLKLETNSGKAEAVRQGVLKAFESSPKLIGFWDADLATPLDQIPHFAQLFERRKLEL